MDVRGSTYEHVMGYELVVVVVGMMSDCVR